MRKNIFDKRPFSGSCFNVEGEHFPVLGIVFSQIKKYENEWAWCSITYYDKMWYVDGTFVPNVENNEHFATNIKSVSGDMTVVYLEDTNRVFPESAIMERILAKRPVETWNQVEIEIFFKKYEQNEAR